MEISEVLEQAQDMVPDYLENATMEVKEAFVSVMENPSLENISKNLEIIESDKDLARTFQEVEKRTGWDGNTLLQNIVKTVPVLMAVSTGDPRYLVKTGLDAVKVTLAVLDMYCNPEVAGQNKFLTEQTAVAARDITLEVLDSFFGDPDVKMVYGECMRDIAKAGGALYTFEALKEFNDMSLSEQLKQMDNLGTVISAELSTEWKGIQAAENLPNNNLIWVEGNGSMFVNARFLEKEMDTNDIQRLISCLSSGCFLNHIKDVVNSETPPDERDIHAMNWVDEAKNPVNAAENPRAFYRQESIKDAMKFGKLTARECIASAVSVSDNLNELYKSYQDSIKHVGGKKS